MVDLVLSIGRHESNNIANFLPALVDNLMGIMSCDRSRAELSQMSNFMWTHWDLPPVDAGYKGAEHGFTIYELITSYLQHNVEHHIQMLSTKDQRGNPMGDPRIDGEKGEMLHPRFLQSVAAWGTERVPGYYWIVRDTPAGTLMCSEDLSIVYLVAGMVDKIGNIASRQGKLPVLLYTTLLPVFQYWTYSGQLQNFNTPEVRAKMKHIDVNAVRARVDDAVADGTVSTGVHGGGMLSMMSTTEPSSMTDCFPYTMEEMQRRVENGRDQNNSEADLAFALSTLTAPGREYVEVIRAAAQDRMDPNPESQFVLRRFGYTKKENPDNEAGVLALPSGVLVGHVHFPENDTYTIMHALKAIAFILATGVSNKCPRKMMFDELTVIQPLKQALGGLVEIMYYAPPSREETELASQVGMSVYDM